MTGSSSTSAKPAIGFLGAGLMGAPMVKRLLGAGFDVKVYNRNIEKVRGLEAMGASLSEDPTSVIPCDVVISMLPDLPHFVDLIDKDGGLAERWRSLGSDRRVAVVVMSSVSPVKVVGFGRWLAESTDGRVTVVDAPVSGGTNGAQAGTLSIMVGSSEAEYARLAPVFAPMGATVRRMGELGSGSLAKACNQLIVAATATALGEATVIAERGGLDLSSLFEILEGGLANSQVLQDKKAKLLASDYSATGAASFMRKDLYGLAEASALTGRVGPLTQALTDVFEELMADGLGDSDLIVVREFIRRHTDSLMGQ